MTPRNFNAAELDEMQVDWQRTHNVKMVAELHGCTKRDVAEALGLSPCPKSRPASCAGRCATRPRLPHSTHWWTAA